jgi:hypothetical protein
MPTLEQRVRQIRREKKSRLATRPQTFIICQTGDYASEGVPTMRQVRCTLRNLLLKEVGDVLYAIENPDALSTDRLLKEVRSGNGDGCDWFQVWSVTEGKQVI